MQGPHNGGIHKVLKFDPDSFFQKMDRGAECVPRIRYTREEMIQIREEAYSNVPLREACENIPNFPLLFDFKVAAA